VSQSSPRYAATLAPFRSLARTASAVLASENALALRPLAWRRHDLAARATLAGSRGLAPRAGAPLPCRSQPPACRYCIQHCSMVPDSRDTICSHGREDGGAAHRAGVLQRAVEALAQRDHLGPRHLLPSARNTSTISGNHVRCRSLAGMRVPSREVRELVQRPATCHAAPEPGERHHPIGMLCYNRSAGLRTPCPPRFNTCV